VSRFRIFTGKIDTSPQKCGGGFSEFFFSYGEVPAEKKFVGKIDVQCSFICGGEREIERGEPLFHS
jgi:hypothetical protein